MSKQARAAAALFHLDPECSRADWIKAGMAAKAAGVSFDQFHDWSSSAGNYGGERDCRSVWNSFDKSGPITASSLFGMAYAQGWKELEKSRSSNVNLCASASREVLKASVGRDGSAKADQIWSRCEPATETHEYIMRKQGVTQGVRVYPTGAPPLVIGGQNVAGFLVVPCFDMDGILHTLQFISGQGNKLNLPGAYFDNGCFVVGDLAKSTRVFIVEGIGQAWAVWNVSGCPAAVSFGAGRMKKVAQALRDKHPTHHPIIVPDRGKESEAEIIARLVNGQWIQISADKPENYDVNDYMQEHGAEGLKVLLERVLTPSTRFNLRSGAELSNAPAMRWMVHGVLPTEGLAALYGASGAGKSFLALDIATSIAGGADTWFGRRITRSPVTYVCLEGEQGIGKRIKAWQLHHRKPLPNALCFVTEPFDLLSAEDVSGLAADVRAAGGSDGLIIIDTLNRAAPGADENSSVAMGNIITSAKRLQALNGGLVLLVHHTGKDATKGLRGHSSLYAALDGAIEVFKRDSRREWSVAKSKDDETGRIHAFNLEVVGVGQDDDGAEASSCVVAPVSTVQSIKEVKMPSGGNQYRAMKVLEELLRSSAQINEGEAAQGKQYIELETAVRTVAESLTCERKRRMERAREALSGLIGRGIYSVKDGLLGRSD